VYYPSALPESLARAKSNPFRGLGSFFLHRVVVMNEPRILSPEKQRTRRNIMKMGAILSSAIVVNPLMTGRGLAGQNNNGGKGQNANCLLRGTTIRTTSGGRKIEDLTVGDFLPTMFGGLRSIQWVGRYPFRKGDRSKPWVKAALPVRVARSALAPNVPHNDLYSCGNMRYSSTAC
jgi:hypothetical protein